MEVKAMPEANFIETIRTFPQASVSQQNFMAVVKNVVVCETCKEKGEYN